MTFHPIIKAPPAAFIFKIRKSCDWVKRLLLPGKLSNVCATTADSSDRKRPRAFSWTRAREAFKWLLWLRMSGIGVFAVGGAC